MELAGLCWPELATGCTVLLVPLGSCEQHGPHLPVSTDSVIAASVAHRVAARLREAGVAAVCAPALPFGASGEHQQFPGTISIGHEALRAVLVELGRSASQWAERIVFVNGHGGNLESVLDAVERLRFEGRSVDWVGCGTPGGDAHAGHTETSLLLAIAPETVRLGAAEPGCTESIADLLPRLRAVGVGGVSPNGVLGDPTGASAAAGAGLLAELVRRVVAKLQTVTAGGSRA
jgi:creatinine amidohydrolase